MKEKNRRPKNERKKAFLPDLSQYPKPVTLLNALFTVLLFSICLFVSYQYCIKSIGDGAYEYSDETYQHIENTIATCVIPEIGIDTLSLQKEVTKYSIDYENGSTQLVCSIQDGYFNAAVTAILSEDFSITSNSRNYNSHIEYMNEFWLTFGIYVFFYAIMAFCLIELSFFIILIIIAFFAKKILSKSSAEGITEKESSDTSDLVTQSQST